MGWTSPPSWVAGNVIGATDLNTYVRDNTNYLLARPLNSIKRDNNANYTTTSTTFVDIDGTNLAITLTISGSAILMGFTGVQGINNVGTSYDFTIDGTRYASAGTNGVAGMLGNNTNPQNVSLTALATGLSSGSHTIKIQWMVNTAANTLTLFSGAGVAGTDYIPTLWAVEVG